jgi:osmoprotectant transport system ATP-binding protein
MGILSYRQVTKHYPGGFRAVSEFSLDIDKGVFVVLIGPSGCGKTTILRMTNRLIEQSEGAIFVDGVDHRSLNPVQLRRKLGYVIQDIGLMPHYTVAENITFVMSLMGIPRATRYERAAELLKLVGMDPDTYLFRFPRELSGGQQQRIGVLRALAHDPEIVLMDEPFGALDPIARLTLQMELKKLQKSVHKTILFVTHDMDEALLLADVIVIMQAGRTVQVGPPAEILYNPANAFVRGFIGQDRILHRVAVLPVGSLLEARTTNGVTGDLNQSGPTPPMVLRSDTPLIVALSLLNPAARAAVVDGDNRVLGYVTLQDIQQAIRVKAESMAKVANEWEVNGDDGGVLQFHGPERFGNLV